MRPYRQGKNQYSNDEDHVEDGDVVSAGHNDDEDDDDDGDDDDDDDDDKEAQDENDVVACRTRARSTPTAVTTSTRVKQPTSTNVAGQAMTAEIRYPLPFSH